MVDKQSIDVQVFSTTSKKLEVYNCRVCSASVSESDLCPRCFLYLLENRSIPKRTSKNATDPRPRDA